MKNPFFSIVIPTRQRHETLPYAIRTITEQDFNDYEIVVCDNNSSIETRLVVEELQNDKIKYIRSNEDLYMSDNWELALSHVSGEYVILFGDDDGMIDGSLKLIYNTIKKTNFSVINWERVYYEWPSSPVPEYANKLTVHLKNHIKILDSKNIIKKILDFNLCYTNLPMLYNSAIKLSLIKDLKQKTGRVFSSAVPDIFSGFAFAYLAQEYLRIEMPLSINGGSQKSTGGSSLLPKNKINEEIATLFLKSNIKWHHRVPYIKSSPAGLLDSFLQCRDILNIVDINIDFKKFIEQMVLQLKTYNQKELTENLDKIKKTYEYDNSLLQYYNNCIEKNQPKISNFQAEKYIFGELRNRLIIFDASKFEVFDVLHLSKFLSGFYDYSFLEESIVSKFQEGSL